MANSNSVAGKAIDYSSIGRLQLEALCKDFECNLTSTQERCTELLEENRELKLALESKTNTCENLRSIIEGAGLEAP
jgi:hypothetical protein